MPNHYMRTSKNGVKHKVKHPRGVRRKGPGLSGSKDPAALKHGRNILGRSKPIADKKLGPMSSLKHPRNMTHSKARKTGGFTSM